MKVKEYEIKINVLIKRLPTGEIYVEYYDPNSNKFYNKEELLKDLEKCKLKQY